MAQQKVANDYAALKAEISASKSKILIGGQDGKIFCDIANYFNAGGVLQPVPSSGSKASSEVLPTTGKASNCGSVWTIEQIEEMAWALAKYGSGWELTGVCYTAP